MRITIPANNLSEELKFLKSSLRRKHISDQHCVNIVADGGVRMWAFDGLVCLESDVDCDIEKTGECKVPGRPLYGIVRKFDGDVTIEVNGPHVDIVCGSSSYQLENYSDIIYPYEEQEYSSVDVNFGTLKKAREFAKDDPTDQVFSCVCIDPEFVAGTDKTKLFVDIKETGAPNQLLMFGESLDRIKSFEEPNVYCSEKLIRMVENHRTMTTNTISKKYPDVKTVIPDDSSNSITFVRDEILDALERFSVAKKHHSEMTSERSDLIIDGENIRLQGVFTGSKKVAEEKQMVKGKQKIAMNPDDLITCLENCNHQEVDMRNNGPETQMIVQKDPYIIVMPIKIK